MKVLLLLTAVIMAFGKTCSELSRVGRNLRRGHPILQCPFPLPQPSLSGNGEEGICGERSSREMPMRRRRGTGLTALHWPFLHLLSGPIQIQGSLAEFRQMILLKTGKRAETSYAFYGCHCGWGGKGSSKDATDR